VAKFGLACEGLTDQIVIENILIGYYKDCDDLNDEIHPLQPARDETDKATFGGWEILLKYLSETRFRDDVLNSEYVVIQIDTDDSEHVNFNVPHSDEDNKELSSEKLIENIKDNLINKIGIEFYDENKEKIIFAISVHSLECWILPLYKEIQKEKTKNCFQALQRESKELTVQKNYKSYDALSQALSKHKTLLKITKKNSSLKIFVSNLPKLS